jgi:hypothetical protein
MGVLEYERFTEKMATRIRVRVSQYIGEEEQGHLLSVFGNDSDVGAITAAVHERTRFRVTFPDGRVQEMSMGERAAYFRGGVNVPGRNHAVRHMIALSEEIRGLGSTSRTFALSGHPISIWTTMVQRLGLPAVPEWAGYMIRVFESHGRIQMPDSFGCFPVAVSATPEEVLEWMEAGVATGTLLFPEVNGPIGWPSLPLSDHLRANSGEAPLPL